SIRLSKGSLLTPQRPALWGQLPRALSASGRVSRRETALKPAARRRNCPRVGRMYGPRSAAASADITALVQSPCKGVRDAAASLIRSQHHFQLYRLGDSYRTICLAGAAKPVAHRRPAATAYLAQLPVHWIGLPGAWRRPGGVVRCLRTPSRIR